MFGMIQACSHHLEPELLEQWRAHLCGLCVNLRDTRGQMSRAATNTDAVMLSVLVEAQRRTPAARKTAGPCPLRGMQTASIISPATAGPRLGATASLVLAAAKANDKVLEHRHQLGTSSVTARVAGVLAGTLTDKALADHRLATAIGATDLLDQLGEQGSIESRVQFGDELDEVTEPTSFAAAQIFASAADLASVPANRSELALIGAAFGRLAHLIDAVQDLEKDKASGSFNPITATGQTMDFVRNRCRHLAKQIRLGFDRLELRDGRLLQALLVDGVRRAVKSAFEPMGGSCSTHPHQQHSFQPAALQPADLELTRAPHLSQPHVSQPPYQAPPGQWPPPDAPPGQAPPGQAPPGQAPPGQAPPGYVPPQWPGDERPPRPPNQKFWPNILPWVGVYCTGYACCADHTNPCTGIMHQAGCKNCDCCGDCDCCCDSCDCCNCCDCNC